MLTDAQVDARRHGLGGSDAAAAAGVSRWRTPLAVYLEKRGEAPPFEGNEFTRWGQALEPAIRQAYSDATGRIVRLPEETLFHASIPFLLCHPDGVTDEGRLFEAKNTRSGEGWGEPGTDQVPIEHLIQVQHNMLVMGLRVADVAVLVAGSDFRIYEVPADQELQDMLIERESDLWMRIEKAMPPPPVNAHDVQALYGHASLDLRIQADPTILGQFELLRALKAKASVVDVEIEKLETEIKSYMAHADTLVNGRDVLATWKASKPVARLDTAALKASHPDIANQFTKLGEPSRRFLLKNGDSR